MPGVELYASDIGKANLEVLPEESSALFEKEV